MERRWKAFFAGDIVIEKNDLSNIHCGDMMEIINAHDIRSCNFEAPLISGGFPHITKIGPNLHQHPHAAEIVMQSGFNVVSLANNHIMDYGLPGLEYTLSRLSEVTTVGAGMNFSDAYGEKLFHVNGVCVGFLCFAEWGFGATIDDESRDGGFAWINHPAVGRRISDLKKKVDVCIVQIHAGAENVDLPLPEWRARYRECIDLGADVVIGHHPHVPQGWETYKERLICYSLGNYYFDYKANSYPTGLWNRGCGVSLTFKGKQLDAFEVIPIEKTASGVRVCSDPGFKDHLDELCRILEPAEYLGRVDAMILGLWETCYQLHYMEAVNGIFPNTPLSRLVKIVIKRLIGKITSNELFLLHNIKIESHRYCVERAMIVKNKMNRL